MTRAVIFDFDGVIVDSLDAIYEIYGIMAMSLNFRIPPTPKDLVRMFGKGNFYELFRNLGIVDPEKQEKAIEIFKQNERRMYENSRLYPDIKRILKDLKERGYKIGVVSNNWQEQLDHTLGKHGLTRHIDAVIGLNGIKKVKPDPALLLKCMEELGVSGEDCVYVGDMIADVLAARNAGIRVIAVTYGYGSREALSEAEPDFLAGSPEEIIGNVGKCLK